MAVELMSGPSRGGCDEARRFLDAEQAVHPLNCAARCTLDEVVERAHHDYAGTVARARELGIVARRDILDPRGLGADAHERRMLVVVGELAKQIAGGEWLAQF